MKAVVVDASVAVKWVVAEPDSEKAALLLQCDTRHAPDHWLAEASTALWAKVGRNDLTPAEGEERLLALLRAPVRGAPIATLMPRAFAISIAQSITVYDLLYVALAEFVDVPLITADLAMIRRLASDPALANRVIPVGSLSF